MVQMKKMVWIRADRSEDFESRKDMVRTSLEKGFFDILVIEEDLERLRKLGRFNPIRTDGEKIVNNGSSGIRFEIRSKKDVEKIMELKDKTDLVLVSAESWKVIPLENLIAGFRGSGTKLLAEVKDASEASLFLETLELGVDGVVLGSDDTLEITRMRELIDGMDSEKMDIREARITELRPVGTGDRVCIDTCSILNEGEGMLVGSGSSGLFLVHSESVESEYVETRPFRVNAGSIHSYVLAPGDRTMYLSDLRVGDRVLAVDNVGNTRAVTVGRLKIERRPLLLIEAESDGTVYNIIVQNAETVRLVSGGKPVSIVDLRQGDRILLKKGTGGRHFGMKVEETISEK